MGSFFVVPIVCILIVGLAVFPQLQRMSEINHRFMQHAQTSVGAASELKQSASDIRRLMLEIVRETNPAKRDELSRKLVEYDALMLKNIQRLQASKPGADGTNGAAEFGELDALYRRFVAYRTDTLDLLKAGYTDEAWKRATDNDAASPNGLLEQQLKRFDASIASRTHTIDAEAKHAYLSEKRTAGLLIAGVVLTFLAMSIAFYRSITRPLQTLRTRMVELAEGRLDHAIPYRHLENEIGDMSRAVEVLQQVYRQQEMQHWVTTNIASISTELQQTRNYADFAHRLLARLAPLLDAGQAMLFVADEENRRLSEIGSYGGAGLDRPAATLAWGQGLVGQCAIEQQTIAIENPPASYLQISSGLGQATPQSILIQPLTINERVLGVLELASFKPFGAEGRALLDGLAPIVAMGMEIIERNSQTQQLLEATQQQAESLEKQAAQVEEQAVELEFQQAELKETQAWYRGIIESAPDGMLVSDKYGTIMLANPQADALFGYETGGLVGVGIETLVPLDVRAGHARLRENYQHTGESRLMGGLNENLRGLRKDGTTFPVEVGLSRLPALGGRDACFCATVRDITLRCEAEAALTALEERSRLILGAVGDGIIGMDVQGRVVFINPAVSRLLGYSEAALIGNTTEKLIRRTFTDGGAVDLECCAIHLTNIDGQSRTVDNEEWWIEGRAPIPVEYTTTPIRKGETIVGSVVVFRDISERKRAALAIAASEQRLDLAIRGANLGLWDWRIDSAEIVTNDIWAEMLGYTDEELKAIYGTSMDRFTALAHPDDLPHSVDLLQKHLRGETAEYRCALRMRAKSGEWKWILDIARGAEHDSDGHPQRVVGIHLDIDEQKRAEQKILFNRHVVENSGPMLWIDVATGKAVYANKAALDHLGYTAEEFYRMDLTQIVDDIDIEYLPDSAKAIRASGKPINFESRHRHKDEHPIDVAIATFVADDGDRTLLISTVTDITERKRAEVAMRAAKELAEDSTRMKSDFLANMSHEIRTPMNAIIGMAHLALRTELTPRQRDYLKKIQGSGQHLLGIINDILDFSKIEAGKLAVEHTDFELEKVLDNVANLIGEKTGAKGLELVFDVDAAVPRYLIGDPLRLGQILINYANNAVKFTERGEIAIRVQRLDDADDAVLLHFAVKDTGIGLGEEQIGRLFQSFSQADASTTRKFGGTGLGLAISKKLAELMGGEVGVDSRLGHGSTFWFTARLGHSHVEHRSLLPAADLRGRQVLVVDDNDHARAVIATTLQSMSFAVDDVASGRLAVEAMQRAANPATGGAPYEIVFLDWQMPEMDGLETARMIRSMGFSPPPHLVMITAFGREEVLKQAEVVGIEDVIVKPVSASLLFDTAMRLLGADRLEQHRSSDEPILPLDGLQTIRGARILLVEDNELNQEVATELLHDVGMVVDIAGDGAVALRRLQEADYDIILMDMQMPVMDGVTATREIKKLGRYDLIPIVAMTANAMQVDKDRCLAAGMVDFVAKPIEPDELWRMLLKWIPARADAMPPAPMALPSAELAVGNEIPRAIFDSIPSHIPGLNIALGLRRVLGKHSLYLSLLKKFVAGQHAAAELMRNLLDEDDWASAERVAHTLKGLAGNIGAVELQGDAAELEAAIKARQVRASVDSLLAATEIRLKQLVAVLQQKLPAEPPAPIATNASSVDRAALESVCIKLAALLANDNSKANEVLKQHRDLFQAALGAGLTPLENAVVSYEYDEALKHLAAATGKLGFALTMEE